MNFVLKLFSSLASELPLGFTLAFLCLHCLFYIFPGSLMGYFSSLTLCFPHPIFHPLCRSSLLSPTSKAMCPVQRFLLSHHSAVSPRQLWFASTPDFPFSPIFMPLFCYSWKLNPISHWLPLVLCKANCYGPDPNCSPRSLLYLILIDILFATKKNYFPKILLSPWSIW